MFKNTSKIWMVSLLLVGTLLAACAGQAPQPAATNNQSPAPTPTNSAPPVLENGGEAGVEAAMVTYSDSTQGFSIGHPSSWSQDKSLTSGVKFTGGDDHMTLEFVTPPAGSDVMTYAKNDVAPVTAAFPGFTQLSLAPSTEVAGAVILGFNASGTSAVTGKAFTAHNERYYIPLADGRIAVLTMVGPDNHYDREGMRDIALTLKITK